VLLEILLLKFDLSRLNLTPNNLLYLVINIQVRFDLINILLMLMLLILKQKMSVLGMKRLLAVWDLHQQLLLHLLLLVVRGLLKPFNFVFKYLLVLGELVQVLLLLLDQVVFLQKVTNCRWLRFLINICSLSSCKRRQYGPWLLYVWWLEPKHFTFGALDRCDILIVEIYHRRSKSCLVSSWARKHIALFFIDCAHWVRCDIYVFFHHKILV